MYGFILTFSFAVLSIKPARNYQIFVRLYEVKLHPFHSQQ